MTQLDRACENFRSLMEEQQRRIACIDAKRIDFSQKETVTIGLVDGDGIGPIIMKQAERILSELLKQEIKAGSVAVKKIQGLTIENRTALGESVPKQVMSNGKCQCDTAPGTGSICQYSPGVNSAGVD